MLGIHSLAIETAFSFVLHKKKFFCSAFDAFYFTVDIERMIAVGCKQQEEKWTHYCLFAFNVFFLSILLYKQTYICMSTKANKNNENKRQSFLFLLQILQKRKKYNDNDDNDKTTVRTTNTAVRRKRMEICICPL